MEGWLMIGALLAFNPETHRIGDGRLLFGVTIPPPPRLFWPSAIEELDLASHFLDARSWSGIATILQHIIRRASGAQGRAMDPALECVLLRQLMRAATTVRESLRSTDNANRFLVSPEAIFGTELDGMSPEDQELETARRFVRFADEMTRAATAAGGNESPHVVTSRAEHVTANRLAPGLMRAIAAQPMGFRARHRASLGP
jgi:hypothetical protein